MFAVNPIAASRMPNLDSRNPDFDVLPRDCWAEINTTQLAENFRILRKHAGVPALAVVKANGYGHGYELAAHAFLKAGAAALGVATLSEAVLLRRAGIDAPVLIICGMLPGEMAAAAKLGFEFFVWREDHIAALRQMPSARVHLKVDTGMGRLGCAPQDAVKIAAAIAAMQGVEFAGLATHFASAYNPELPETDKQIALFDQVIAALGEHGIRPRSIHAANSSGAIAHPRGRYDMVRIGVALYGVPGDRIPLPPGVGTALAWRARVVSTSVLPKGAGVGYAHEHVMPEEGRIGVLPVGYADGFRRVPKNVNTVLIEGQERRVLGRVCMDQCMVDLSGLGDIVGTEATLIGKQGGKELFVKDVAKRWGTNAHDVYCGISPRVPRRAR